MRVAAISDIHANLPAFEAVLTAIEEADIEETWCLGDIVGYGADPDACAELAKGRCDLLLAGNHDLAALGEIDISSFSPAAGAAIRWTRANAADRTFDLLRPLEASGRREGIGLFHASPRDPVWEYVLDGDQAAAGMDAHTDRVGLIGHSHIALFFHRAGGGSANSIRGEAAGEDRVLELGGDGTWLLNPGSVGQPRDGDARAAWLEIDIETEMARFHRVPYDIDAAAEAISRAGLPIHLGERLYLGQ